MDYPPFDDQDFGPPPSSSSSGGGMSWIIYCVCCILCICYLCSSSIAAYFFREDIDAYLNPPIPPAGIRVTVPDFFTLHEPTEVKIVIPVWADAKAEISCRGTKNDQGGGAAIWSKKLDFVNYRTTFEIPTDTLDVGLNDLEGTFKFIFPEEEGVLSTDEKEWLEAKKNLLALGFKVKNPLGHYSVGMKTHTHMLADLQFDVNKFPAYAEDNEFLKYYTADIRVEDRDTHELYKEGTYKIQINPTGNHPSSAEGLEPSTIRYGINVWKHILDPCKWIQQNKPTSLAPEFRDSNFPEDTLDENPGCDVLCSINYKNGDREIRGEIKKTSTLLYLLEGPTETYIEDCCTPYFKDPSITEFTCKLNIDMSTGFHFIEM